MMSKNSGNFKKLGSLTPNTCSNDENKSEGGIYSMCTHWEELQRDPVIAHPTPLRTPQVHLQRPDTRIYFK